ncbi:chemotaxis protein CheX [Lacrimispora defluvii]|uniref:Chemotaxis protein CheX n=1 Tax=Lacrimispora defluvii TaxID=2719233 RepID=A0ABX1VWH0_9FIRM|nr:chemotaxis protein CheX [Lacrimispora defluvii]NNJ32370.1 chemotaxis protein CheX [Lacrimispora defluvii]
MDVKYINPFIEAFLSVMPQLGFEKVEKTNLCLKDCNLTYTGVIMTVGIVGEIKGNVVYYLNLESAKKVASTMMMGMPVDEFNEMAQSAISELANMLTANAATFFSNIGITVDISTPTLLYGDQVSVKMNSNQILCIQLLADDIPIDINIAIS